MLCCNVTVTACLLETILSESNEREREKPQPSLNLIKPSDLQVTDQVVRILQILFICLLIVELLIALLYFCIWNIYIPKLLSNTNIITTFVFSYGANWNFNILYDTNIHISVFYGKIWSNFLHGQELLVSQCVFDSRKKNPRDFITRPGLFSPAMLSRISSHVVSFLLFVSRPADIPGNSFPTRSRHGFQFLDAAAISARSIDRTWTPRPFLCVHGRNGPATSLSRDPRNFRRDFCTLLMYAVFRKKRFEFSTFQRSERISRNFGFINHRSEPSQSLTRFSYSIV